MDKADLAGLLTSIWKSLSELRDHVTEATEEINKRLNKIEMQLLHGRHRMASMERKQRKQTGTTTKLRSFLGQVATFREWAAGAALVILALKGALNPGEVKAMLLSFINAAP